MHRIRKAEFFDKNKVEFFTRPKNDRLAAVTPRRFYSAIPANCHIFYMCICAVYDLKLKMSGFFTTHQDQFRQQWLFMQC